MGIREDRVGIKEIFILIMSLSFVFGMVVLSGCISSTSFDHTRNQDIREIAKSKCVSLCVEAKNNSMDLSNGPCLSDNNPSWNIEDWVCDVAHIPRRDVDNLPENQCKMFREGKAHHFVEVDEGCNVIRVY